jgi:hypothetical protein
MGSFLQITRQPRDEPLDGTAHGAGGETHPRCLRATTFNFSANHLFFLSRNEYRWCAVLQLLDRDTRRIYQLYDSTQAPRLVPGQA